MANRSKVIPKKTKHAEKRARDKAARTPQQKTAHKSLEPLTGPELVFGLVGPIGTDLNMVSHVLEEELGRVNYKTCLVQISQLMHILDSDLPTSGPEDERYSTHMQAGTRLRGELGEDLFALLSSAKISAERANLTQDPNSPAKRQAYIIRSLKHPEEVEVLRNIYGRAFYLVAATAPRDSRKSALAEKIAKSRHKPPGSDEYLPKAEELIVWDEEEANVEYGQRVRDTFPLADLFIVATEKATVEKSLRRFVELIFGHPFHTPTKDELAMFYARATALRSADLSRQVGAAITTTDGDLLSVGCNEVPKFGGGLYWDGDNNDARDFKVGYDSSAKNKQILLQELLQRLKESKWLTDEKVELDAAELAEQALRGTARPLRGTRISELLEFGRIVHAEMAAITDAARRGTPLKEAKLYCTTFPCHMCARHIVAAGIKRVIYIEPYPKSMAKGLYRDSIRVDSGIESDHVTFDPFIGIAPGRFMDLFEKTKRKIDNGDAVEWQPAAALPRLKRLVPSYIFIEQMAKLALRNTLEAKGFGHATAGGEL
ncbi:deoxycytidylate deaminase [Ferrovibrio terrae]|uniref:Deoxycytidylate deaminase n=1 Tax=Ferrovibrio terrae TaxID=2594003 RepID=A0A516H103_9PROT|nr:anti-phage dCTP deaminase [Ferrovibrio terrae]QDO97473.1 deoxycytidylate deaminase [Ferrovibrio terrae]